jgi:hypothetical protein
VTCPPINWKELFQPNLLIYFSSRTCKFFIFSIFRWFVFSFFWFFFAVFCFFLVFFVF